jgi:hypothetical protein
MNYPKKIYVQSEDDGDTSYLLAWDNPEDANDGKVAVYRLDTIVNKKTKVVIS